MKRIFNLAILGWFGLVCVGAEILDSIIGFPRLIGGPERIGLPFTFLISYSYPPFGNSFNAAYLIIDLLIYFMIAVGIGIATRKKLTGKN
jgi:hypothetical protein